MSRVMLTLYADEGEELNAILDTLQNIKECYFPTLDWDKEWEIIKEES